MRLYYSFILESILLNVDSESKAEIKNYFAKLIMETDIFEEQLFSIYFLSKTKLLRFFDNQEDVAKLKGHLFKKILQNCDTYDIALHYAWECIRTDPDAEENTNLKLYASKLIKKFIFERKCIREFISKHIERVNIARKEQVKYILNDKSIADVFGDNWKPEDICLHGDMKPNEINEFTRFCRAYRNNLHENVRSKSIAFQFDHLKIVFE